MDSGVSEIPGSEKDDLSHEQCDKYRAFFLNWLENQEIEDQEYKMETYNTVACMNDHEISLSYRRLRKHVNEMGE